MLLFSANTSHLSLIYKIYIISILTAFFVQDKLHTCPVVQELRLSLEAERDSVFNFLFTAVDETMTPAQEAYLDIASYPWCPDIWAITTILAQKNKVTTLAIKLRLHQHVIKSV